MDDQKELILSVLSQEKGSLSLTALAQKTGLNRHAVARHMDVLELLGKVRKIEKGVAKKYLLVQSLPVSGLIDISSDLILIINQRMEIQYLNTAASRYLSTTGDTILGERLDVLNLSLFSHPDIIHALNSYTVTKSVKRMELSVGSAWFEIAILGFSLLTSPDLLAIMASDSTDQKKSEEELHTIQEKYSIAFQSSPDAIIISDLKTGELLEVNEATCTMTGYSRDELIGQTTVGLRIFTNEVIRQEAVDILRRDAHKSVVETTICRKNGERLSVSIIASLISIRGRDCLLSTTRDITEKKEAEEKIGYSQLIVGR